MAIRHPRLWLVLSVAMLAALPARAQFAPAPETYTVVEISALMGPPGETMTVYRSGSKAVIDITHPGQTGPDAAPVRSLYDLQAHTNHSWNLTDGSAGCGGGTFSGSWGDPFADSADMTTQLTQANAKQTGMETVNGFSTKVYEVTADGQTMKAWVDAKYGLLIKLQSGTGATMQEIKSLTLTAPAASFFVLPAACTAATAAVVTDDSAKFAAETGGNGADYASATDAPTETPATSCTVVFKVVMMGTMQPITSGYELGLSLDQDPSSPTKPVTSQLHNGSLVIPNAPPLINLSLNFGDGGGADAFIHRQCFGPKTILYFIVKNPGKITDATDWLWSKTGK